MSVHEICEWPNCGCYNVPGVCLRGGEKPAKRFKMADEILREAAVTFEERNKVYGNNYERVGEVMAGLFPDGITLKTPQDHNRFHIFMLIIVKLSRYAVNWEKGHQDSIRDTATYAAMLEMIDDQT